MKKLVQLNVVCNGSTGRIMCDVAREANNKGYNTYCFYGRGKANDKLNCIRVGNKLSTYFHILITRLFNKTGHGSYFATKKMINQIKKINPDIIHMHNIHGYWLNLNVLFKYLKMEYKGKIVWTLHDCWAFTGHCAHFTAIKCDKWKYLCQTCPQKESYPKSIVFDTSKSEYILKKELVAGIKNLTLIVPSNWLAGVVKQSFLNNYPIKVINNGVNLSTFKPTFDKNIFNMYSIPNNKKILLGVANIWEERKGLNIFIELSKLIDKKTIIVLVGLTKKQIGTLPKNIIGIERTDNIDDLVKIYTIADVFVNPSLEETFSLVTVEAMSCGTPVVVSGTSAVKDLVDSNSGIVVKKETAKEYLNCINKIDCNKSKIINQAKKYSIEKNLENYLKLYKEF